MSFKAFPCSWDFAKIRDRCFNSGSWPRFPAINLLRRVVMKALGRIALAFLFFIQLILNCFSQSGIITTYVGPSGLPVNGASATTQIIDKTYAIALDGTGGFYFISSQNRVCRVTASGSITLTAGIGNYGFSGDGGSATTAQLASPQGLAVDSAGNLYIADTGNHRIRKVTPGGVISTVAGNGVAGYSGDGGAATSAQLYGPYGVAVDSLGNLYIADTYNFRIRMVTSGGVIATIAGRGTQGFSGDEGLATSATLSYPFGVALDSAGNIYISDSGNNRVREVTSPGSANAIISTIAGTGTAGFSGDGGSALLARVSNIRGLAVDTGGNVYIADVGNSRIRKFAPGGNINTVAGTGTAGFSGDGSQATAAQLASPTGVAVDGAGNLYIADTQNDRIRMVAPGGVISTIAGIGTAGYTGDGASLATPQLTMPESVAVDSAGNLYIADTGNNRLRKVTTAGVISTVAGTGTAGYSQDGGQATAAQLASPTGVAVDSAGNIYIADYGTARIRKVTMSTGVISTVAGTGTAGFSGDGGAATSAKINLPFGVAVDSAGNIYIADTSNNRIRKVASGGTISTVAGTGTAGFGGDGAAATSAKLSSPYGVAVDASGNLYIADTGNNRIRMVTTAGIINTVAGNTAGSGGDGGPATSAQLNNPTAVMVDAGGNLYIGDTSNNRIRLVTAAGIISTVAGNGSQGFGGDDGPATSALLDSPSGVTVDSGGNLYIADTGNNRIRKVGIYNAVYFPQVAVGGGYTTVFTITNTGVTAASGIVTLTDQQANPFSVNGILTDSLGTAQPAAAGSFFPFTVPSGGTIFLSAAGLTANTPTTSGWAELQSIGGSLTGAATYEYASGGILQFMVGVLQSPLLQFATIPVDNDSTQNKQMAYAIANPSSQTISIKLALVGQDGTVVDDTLTVTLGPGQQTARFISWDLPARANFKGSMVLRGQAGASFTAVALEQKQGLYTVIPLVSGKAPGIPN